jgi:hypothetical protein
MSYAAFVINFLNTYMLNTGCDFQLEYWSPQKVSVSNWIYLFIF